MPEFKIPVDVKFILKTIEDSGFGAHIVGGCVRDMLIGKNPTDYDITTSATPEEIKEIFSRFRTVDTGIKHGTVTLLYNGSPYEITTYRTEGGYTDNRHPDSVSFTRNLFEDLSRRDFTVNAICMDSRGNITDAFCGVEDIKKRTIRAVGDADIRFAEDALRILRAIRFSSTLGFKLEKKTAEAVVLKRKLLSGISGERIYSEIMKLLSGEWAYTVLLEYPSVIKEIFPELSSVKLPEKTRFDKAQSRERLVALFALGAKNPTADFDKAMCRLHTDSKIRELGGQALLNLNADTATQSALLRLLFELGEESAAFAASVKELTLGVECVSALRAAQGLGIAYKISDMNATGDDFLKWGFSGKQIGSAMREALFAIIDGVIPNECEAIKNYARRVKEKS